MQLQWIDYVIIVIYFAFVLGIGFVLKRFAQTSTDFFLSGRSIPAWITGLAFISANLGAQEVIGMGASGAKYGVATSHFYWIGAIPAMVFVGIFMMPFYYGSRARSVPEYLKLRFDEKTRGLNAISFAAMTVFSSGVSMYAMGKLLQLLLGWDFTLSVLLSAGIVLIYTYLGGLTSAIYNEVLQFFIIVASLLPLTLVALHDMGGWGGLQDKIKASPLKEGGLHAWQGLGIGNVTNPIDANWLGIVLGLGFVLSFGYWTTNFAEVQRALSAKNMSAARRTPLIGAYPKIFIPALTIIPGLVALVTVKGLGGSNEDLQYNNAIPLLIGHYLPEGMLGLAVTGLLAAFMAGVAANVTSFNTVVTYDLWQSYVVKDRDPKYYVRTGRLVTVGGLLISVATAFIAKGYSNIMNYVQLLFSYFNAPLFATFIIAMFWRRTTPWAGFWGLIAGFLGAFVTHELASSGTVNLGSELAASFWGAVVAFGADAVVTVVVSLITQPKPEDELRGLVWGLPRKDAEPERMTEGDDAWYRSVWLLGGVALGLVVILNIIFI